MHSFIITANNQQKALEKIAKILASLKIRISPEKLLNSPDIILIKPENSISIKQIRSLKTLLSRKPISLSKKVGIIFKANLMTISSQNAFLKLSEEPGKSTLLFLITKSPQSLLATILSRCQIITLKSEGKKIKKSEGKKILKFIKEIKDAKPGKRLQLIELFEKNREEAIKFCQNTIYVLESQLTSKDCCPCSLARTVLAKLLYQTQQALNDLENNVNAKLVLDNWALNLPCDPRKNLLE